MCKIMKRINRPIATDDSTVFGKTRDRAPRNMRRTGTSFWQSARQFSSNGHVGLSMHEIREIAKAPPTPLSLQQMKLYADSGDKLRIHSAQFLHHELRLRFARAIVELTDLPIGLGETYSVKKAIDVYAGLLDQISKRDAPTTLEDDVEFTKKLANAKKAATNLVPLICGSLREIRQTDLGNSALMLTEVQDDIRDRLDTFFLTRLGIRLLIGQHVESMNGGTGRVKLVDVEDTIQEAVSRAKTLCEKYLGEAPSVDIRFGANTKAPFMYVESHLHHMVFEIIKNAMQATVVHHRGMQERASGPLNRVQNVMDNNSRLLGFYLPSVDEVQGVTIYPDVSKYRTRGQLPPIDMVVCQGQEDLAVKISDEGGGVQRSKWDKLWRYDYSTSPPYPPPGEYGHHSFREHFAGGGYGLPISRLFARYFGGEVTFTSLEGTGSNVFLQVPRLGVQTELVPGHENFHLQPLRA